MLYALKQNIRHRLAWRARGLLTEPCCDGSGTCDDACDPDQCMTCDGAGTCISECDDARCEVCDGMGGCVSACDEDNCEECEGGECKDTCPDCEICDMGTCSDVCTGCCQQGNCVSDCDIDQCFAAECVDGQCRYMCDPDRCQECDGNGNCSDTCEEDPCQRCDGQGACEPVPQGCSATGDTEEGCPGDTRTINFTIKNLSSDCESSFSFVVIVTSGAEWIGASPGAAVHSGSTGNLTPGGTFPGSFNVTISPDAPSDSQTFFAIRVWNADGSSAQPTCLASASVSVKDCACQITELTDGIGCAGGEVILNRTIKNTGQCTADLYWEATKLAGTAQFTDLPKSGTISDLDPGAEDVDELRITLDPAAQVGQTATIRLTVRCDNANGEVCHTDEAIVTVAEIESVEWVDAANLEDTLLHGGGKRIFPGKDSPTGQTRRKVKCKATLNQDVPAGAAIEVHFKAFDVDDPTRTQQGNPIDPNDTSDFDDEYTPGDNRPHDSLGFGPIGIAFAQGSASPVKVQGDQNFAELEFEITEVNPANNWKVFASCSEQEINDVEVDISVPNGTDAQNSFRLISDPGTAPRIEQQSPLLSVWRKLHVEVDSMQAEFLTGTSTSITGMKLTDNTNTWIADQFNSFSEDWKLNPNTAQQDFEIVIDTLPPSTIEAAGDLTGIASVGDPYKVEFVGWDANEEPAGTRFGGDVPDPDTSAFQSAFQECYILPVIEVDNSNTPWHYDWDNDGGNLITYVNGQRGNLPEQDDYWTVYVIGVYENDNPMRDNDPDSDVGSAGANIGAEPEKGIYFIEVVEDYARQHGWTAQEKVNELRAVLLHEIGHQFELQDAMGSGAGEDFHVMWAHDSDPDEDKYGTLPLIYEDSDISMIRGFGTGARP